MVMQARSECGASAPVLVAWRGLGSANASPAGVLAGTRTRPAVRKGPVRWGVDARPLLLRLGSREVLRPSQGAVAVVRRRRVSGGWSWLSGAVVFTDAWVRGVARASGRNLLRGGLHGVGCSDCGAFGVECLAAGHARSAGARVMPRDHDAAGCEGDRQGARLGRVWRGQ
jgi:hypothetical protein